MYLHLCSTTARHKGANCQGYITIEQDASTCQTSPHLHGGNDVSIVDMDINRERGGVGESVGTSGANGRRVVSGESGK